MRVPPPIILTAILSLMTAASTASAVESPGIPFERTESRERCAHYDPNRLPFFGTTHLHTGLSFDASIRFVDYASGNDPRGAYRFAKGLSSIQLPDPLGFQGPDPLRNPRIDRPTDWGAVTDHSEHFGEMGICKNFLGKDAPGGPVDGVPHAQRFLLPAGHEPEQHPGSGARI